MKVWLSKMNGGCTNSLIVTANGLVNAVRKSRMEPFLVQGNTVFPCIGYEFQTFHLKGYAAPHTLFVSDCKLQWHRVSFRTRTSRRYGL